MERITNYFHLKLALRVDRTNHKGERSRTTIEALRAFLAPDPENELVSIKRRLSDVEKQLEGMRSPE